MALVQWNNGHHLVVYVNDENGERIGWFDNYGNPEEKIVSNFGSNNLLGKLGRINVLRSVKELGWKLNKRIVRWALGE